MLAATAHINILEVASIINALVDLALRFTLVPKAATLPKACSPCFARPQPAASWLDLSLLSIGPVAQRQLHLSFCSSFTFRVFFGLLPLLLRAMSCARAMPLTRSGRKLVLLSCWLGAGRSSLLRRSGATSYCRLLCRGWKVDNYIELQNLLDLAPANTKRLNTLLVCCGRQLFDASWPYSHYSEVIDAVASKEPALRRCLQPSWDLAFAWLREQPQSHHVAHPWQVLLSTITSAALGMATF